MRSLIALIIVFAWRTAAAEWHVAKQIGAGSMPWGVIATADHVFVAHVGYKDRDNIWRYDAATLRVEKKSRFAGHGVELALTNDGKTLYVGNSRKDHVVALDPISLAVLRVHPTDRGPKNVHLSPDNKTLFAGNYHTNTVTAIALDGGSTKHIKVGMGPRGLAMTPNGKKLYVASLLGSSVSVVDAATLTVIKTLRGCRGASHAAITNDAKLVLVTCRGSRQVQVIDAATDEVVRMIEVGKAPNAIAVTATDALMTNEHDHTVSVIALATWRVTTFAVPVKRPVGIAIAPDGKRAFVTARGSTKLVVLEP